jgi:flagellar protein FlgJ
MLTREEFVKKYAADAISAVKGTGIFPQTILSIAILESQGKAADGNYYPGLNAAAKQANNYFGIKAYPDWKGDTILLNTPGDATKKSRFVKYPTVRDGFKGFVNFLQDNERYERAGVFDSTDYVDQLARLARAGYSEKPDTWLNLTKSIASKFQQYLKSVNTAATNTKNAFPVLFALSLIALYALTQSDEK